MALIKPGVWHENVWVSRTWQEDLWLEYGAVTPPIAPTTPTFGLPRKRVSEFPATVEDVGLLIMLISSLRRQRENANDNSG